MNVSILTDDELNELYREVYCEQIRRDVQKQMLEYDVAHETQTAYNKAVAAAAKCQQS